MQETKTKEQHLPGAIKTIGGQLVKLFKAHKLNDAVIMGHIAASFQAGFIIGYQNGLNEIVKEDKKDVPIETDL